MKHLGIGLAAMLVVQASAAFAHPPPPPPPPTPEEEARDQAFREAACPPGAKPRTTALNISSEAVDGRALGVHDGRVGQLKYLWGLKITASDSRLAGISGLEFDDKLGLIATTRAGDWINFDTVGPNLGDLRSVSVTPMGGSTSSPAGLRSNGGAMLVGYPAEHRIARYQMRDCGLAARAMPLFTLEPPGEVTGIASVFYSYVIFAGTGAGGAPADRVWIMPRDGVLEAVDLHAPEMPVMAHHRLIDITGPAKIVPSGFLALWRPDGDPAQSVLQTFDLPQYGEFGEGPHRVGRTLATLNMQMRAIAAFVYEDREFIFMVTEAPPGEPTYLFGFEMAHEDRGKGRTGDQGPPLIH